MAGVDLGGTASRLVIASAGTIVADRTVLTADLGQGDPETRLSRLADAISRLVPIGMRIKAVGIGASGPVDRSSGVVHNLDTLPAFSEMPIVAMLRARLGVPVTIDNDAVVAAIAEHRAGAGLDAARMLMVTLGTGIGVAFLPGGSPFRGPSGAHPEAGHIPIGADGRRCYCGAEGCWEQLASRTALQKLLQPHLPAATLPRDVLRVAAGKKGEPAINEAYAIYGSLLGRGLAALHALYMPDVTVLGGSAGADLPLFEASLLKALQRAPSFSVHSIIRTARLGNEAGALGAALLAEGLASTEAASPAEGFPPSYP